MSRKEQAELAEKDSDLMLQIADSMRDYAYEVTACGNDGKDEMIRIQALAKIGMKALANYL